jgi:hypothetical protein
MRSLLSWNVMQYRLVVTDVLVQPIGPIYKGQAVEENFFFAYGADRFIRNVGNWSSVVRNIPEEHRSYLYSCRSLKSHLRIDFLYNSRLKRFSY